MSTSVVETVERKELENKDAASIKILPSQDAPAPAATEKTTASLMGTGGYDYPGMPQFTDLHRKRRRGLFCCCWSGCILTGQDLD